MPGNKGNQFFMFSQNESSPGVTDLRISGEIGNSYWSDTVESEFVSRLDAVTSDTLRVRINSPGGEVFAGFNIFNNLKNHKSKVEIEILGLAGSVASVVAMAGDVVRMPRTAAIMIHNPWSPHASGESKNLRSTADALDSMKEMALSAYLSKAKISKEEISEMMDRTVYLTAEEALEKGFIDEILDHGEGVEVDGEMLNCGGVKFQMSAFRNFPKEKFLNNKAKPVQPGIKETGGVVKMTKQELMQQHPELFKEVIGIGIVQERERLQAIDRLPAVTGAEGIVMKAKYDEIQTASEVAIKLLEENTRVGKAYMSGVQADMKAGANVVTATAQVTDEQKLIDDAVAMMRGDKK